MANPPSNKMLDSNTLRSDHAAIRQAFRVPVKYQDEIAVVIDNQAYRVVDICSAGVNITDKKQTPFTIGQLIENCELIIPGSRIKNLTARIVHGSCAPDDNCNNGIQWINLADEALQQIAAIVSKIKQRLRQAARE